MSHQHHHADLTKAVMGNQTEYQMPPNDQISTYWFGKAEHTLLSVKKKVPIAVGNNREEQEGKDEDGLEERVTKTVYHPDHKNFDVLSKISMETFLPEVKVKDEFKGRISICWPRYAIFKFVKILELLMEDERAITTFDSHSLLIKSQYDIPNEFVEEYEHNIGNRPHLLEWSNELPLSKVMFTLPFMFAKDPRLALPLFLHQEKFYSLYGIFRTQLDKILRMKDGEEEIPFDGDFIETKGFTVPKLFGYYTKLSLDEKNIILDEIRKGECIREYDDFITDIIEDDEIELGDISPTKNVFWFAQRERALDTNDFTNFMDSEGTQIIQQSRIFLSKNPQPLVSMDEFELNENLMSHATVKPRVPGIWFHSTGVGKLFSLNNPMTIQFNGLHAHLKIIPQSGEKEKKGRRVRRGHQVEDSEYKLTCILHIVKRVYYTMENDQVRIYVQDEGGAYIKDLQKQILDLPE